MRAAVLGAGIGGLVAALALERAGWDVVVLERTGSFVPVGSGLTIFPNGLLALGHLGVRADVEALRGEWTTRVQAGIRSPDGRWLARWSPRMVADAAVVERSRLHEVLLGALRTSTVETGREVVSAGSAGVRCADGTEVTDLDLVVAADGINSRVRAARPGDPGVRYAGYQAWRAVTDEPVPTEAVGEVWGHGRRFGIAPLGDGRVYWFATETAPREVTRTDEAAVVAELFGSWCDPVPRLLAATARDGVQRLPIEALASPVRHPVDGRVVLVGDAAHAMTPDVGQGANQALEDAAALGALLAGAADVDTALARWTALRVPRWVGVSRQARVAGRTGQLSGPAATVRDALLRLLPTSVLDRQTAALHAWEVPRH